jgi:hypothetical protein
MPRHPFPTSYQAPHIPDLNWTPLESVSGLTFTDPQRAALVKAMNDYLTCLAEVYAVPTMRAVRKRCEDIHKHASALAPLLRLHLTNDTRDNEAQITLLQAVFGLFPIHQDRNSLSREITYLARNTAEVLKGLCRAGQPGRQRQEELRRMIRAWHVVYREAGGTGLGCWWSVNSSQHEGPFLELLDAALLQAEMASRGGLPAKKVHGSRHGLAQMILKVVRQPRKSPTQDKK